MLSRSSSLVSEIFGSHSALVLALATWVYIAFVPAPAKALDGLAESEEPRFRLIHEDLTLTLEGEVELELHDLEGEGGPGRESSTDLRSLGTRSPRIELDELVLAGGLWFSDQVKAHALLSFNPDGASVSAFWIDAKLPGVVGLTHELQVGFYPPIAYRDRRTERYPLVATAFWRNPEAHVAYGASLTLGEHASVSLTGSLSMMRPLTFAPVQDSTQVRGTINVISYGRAEPFSGNGPVGGALLRFDWLGAFVSAFGFLGSLSAEAGTDTLRSTLAGYQHLPGYPSDASQAQDSTFMWGGFRAGVETHGLHIWAEFIGSKEGLLQRVGAYAQVSYVFQFGAEDRLFHRLEPLVRVETLRNLGGDQVHASGRALRSSALSEAPSWDFDALTFAIRTHIYRDLVRFRAEYVLIQEHNGVPELAVPDAPIRNNELLLQLEVGF